MEGIGNSFSLPFKSKDWLGTFAVIGLIALIPIIGQMNLFGWVLTQLDYYRAGRTDIPPAGFNYINRGINVFVTQLVWGLPAGLLIGTGLVVFYISLFGALASASSSASSRASDQAAFSAAMSGGLAILWLFILAGGFLALVLRFFSPAIWVATERRGISGGLNPRYVWSIATTNVSNTLVAALLEYAANVLGSLGTLACYVGWIFTAPYGWLVFAGILRHYEYALQQVEASRTPAAPA